MRVKPSTRSLIFGLGILPETHALSQRDPARGESLRPLVLQYPRGARARG